MNVLIIGPVQSDKYFGGVATFTESLADGFIQLDHQVEIITDYSIKNFTYLGCRISSIYKAPKRRNPLIFKRLAREIDKRKSDLIISSLEYGLSLIFIKPNLAVKIHYLHAFPAKTMAGYFKTKGLNRAMKLISHKVDFMISNSSLTSVVNKEIFGIKSDNVIPIGLGYEFMGRVEKMMQKGATNFLDLKKRGQILYAGRIASEKNIYSILKAIEGLRSLTDISFNFIVIGGGNDLDELIEKYNYNGSRINFLGAKSQEEIVKYYIESEIFISMNPHEPFGITYLEALYTNCKIVCPMSGGHLDFSHFFSNHFYLTNPYQVKAISESLKEALIADVPAFNKKIESYNYKRVSKDIISYVSDEKDIL